MSLLHVRNPEAAERMHKAKCHPRNGAIPDGIYFKAEHDNFYFAETEDGMGQGFYVDWRDRRHEFPQR
jgi:hypothetical protein